MAWISCKSHEIYGAISRKQPVEIPHCASSTLQGPTPEVDADLASVVVLGFCGIHPCKLNFCEEGGVCARWQHKSVLKSKLEPHLQRWGPMANIQSVADDGRLRTLLSDCKPVHI